MKRVLTEDGRDITEAVQILYDIAHSSMGWDSGFLDNTAFSEQHSQNPNLPKEVIHMNNDQTITIHLSDLPEQCRTAKGMRVLADSLADNGYVSTANMFRALADAMPVPLPTTPGSQVRWDGDEWTRFNDGLWWCHTSNRRIHRPAELAALGPFEVIRDAGVETQDS